MYGTMLSTALVLVREGFESVLLTGMIAATLDKNLRSQINLNFLITWGVTLCLGLSLVEYISPHIENIENYMMLLTSIVLFYIFFNSKAIFEHAKEHAAEVKNASLLSVHLTVMLICLREALESTVFLASEIKTDPTGVLQGLFLGIPFLACIVYLMEKIGSGSINKIMFRYVGYGLLALALYYFSHASIELLENVFSIDIY